MKRDPNLGLAILRVVVGGVFAAHGIQKIVVFGMGGLAGFLQQQGIPFPALSAWAVTAAELLGGLALMLGLFTRLAAIPLGFSMLVAILAVHLKGGFFLPDGLEYTLVLMAASATVAVAGPGAWALDSVLARRAAPAAFVARPV